MKARFLAAVVILLILVAATVVIYNQTRPCEPSQSGMNCISQLIVESYDWTDLSSLKVTLLNVGGKPATLLLVRLNVVEQKTLSGTCPFPVLPLWVSLLGGRNELQNSQKCLLEIAVSNPSSFTVGMFYPLYILVDGTAFSFGLKAGFSLP